MNLPDFQDLDLSIARARIALSLIAMLSLYIDPSTAGGLFHLTVYAATTLLCHLAYSVGIYFALARRFAAANLQMLSIVFDLIFATAITFITEGQTSASYVFFVFAIIATASRSSSRPIVTVTFCSVALYLIVVVLTQGITSVYVMRAVYLAIAGYLIGFFRQQRALFAAHAHDLETRAERQSIARSLHDGYAGQLVFSEEMDGFFSRFLHNHTALDLLRWLQLQGLSLVILPVRVAPPNSQELLRFPADGILSASAN